tara:strand:+ start:21155 stop:22258 length:1104 start_codon:yes stop_codon:yes gene_type:complete
MATTYKILTPKDVASTRNLLHEAIPLTGTLVSGTYSEPPAGGGLDGSNIKNYPHGMFQSVYDYPALSSSANHIFDITAGYSNSSDLSSSSNTQNAKKINIYNEMAQVLVGFDENNDVRQFDADGDFISTATKIDDAYFINFTRLLSKDEVKKGSFTLTLGVTPAHNNANTGSIYLKDSNGNTSYKVNSPAGEYGILYATSNNDRGQLKKQNTGETTAAGLIYYQAGIAVITSSVFSSGAGGFLSASITMGPDGKTMDQSLTDLAISGNCDNLRNRIKDISFNNTTELNSTVYFCRANHNEFNYSSNPTYLSASKLVVKNNSSDIPVSYATTVGLYSPDNELLAVAKVSEPLKKDPTNEFTIRVRLDY